MERLIPDASMRHTNLAAIGAYDLFGSHFDRDATDILKEVIH